MRLLIPAIALGCTACAPDTEPIVGRTSQAIAGGYTDADDKAVMSLFHSAGGTLCTSTLIAPNVLLTARHCVSVVVDDSGGKVACSQTGFQPPYAPAGFLVSAATEISSGTVGEFLAIEVVTLPVDDDLLCGQDIAIVILEDGVSITPLEPRLEPLGAGESYSAIGYGATDGAGSGVGTRRRRDDLRVGCVSGGCGISDIKSSEWVGETGVCQGDSGGPAIDDGGLVVGVTSRGGDMCDMPIYGYTVHWETWLKDSVVYASGIGLYDAPAWTEGSTVDPEHSMPIGNSCASNDDCPTGRCLDDGDVRYCTRKCDDAAPCPAEYSCDGQLEGTTVCLSTPSPAALQPHDRDGCSMASGSSAAASGVRGSYWHLMAFFLALVAARRRPV